MLTRNRTSPDAAPDSTEASPGSVRFAIADTAWIAKERVASPFERIGFALQRGLIWPLADRLAAVGRPARALGFGLVLLLAAAAGVGGLIWAAPDGPSEQGTTQTAAQASQPLAVAKATPQDAGPTLHGAAPDFQAAVAKGLSNAGSAKPAGAHAASAKGASSSTASAAAGTASSDATPSSASSSSGANAATVAGAPAGPAAISVARDFAGAFVLYETGASASAVRKAFGESATPELSRSLMRRPPRLPANVTVPKAKVVNVVAAPSHGRVYPVSVSLLRVGVTSELRLEMEQLKGQRWLVTNVLG